MFSKFRALLLRLLRVPHEPEPPFGDPASTRIFRASPKYYSFRLLGWSIGQVLATFGLVVGIVIMLGVEFKAAEIRRSEAARTAAPPGIETNSAAVDQAASTTNSKKSRRRNQRSGDEWAEVVAKVPPGLFLLFWGLKGIGVLIYLTQLLATYAVLRLDWEMRWYMVTDRSLRIRTGIWKVQEMTMSFANLQQVMVSQGPIQRLLGIADVRVQSAGGGGSSQHGHERMGNSMHIGFFHGVDNAAEVRDLILARLRHFRETGLGDPDEQRHPLPALTPAPPQVALNISDADAVVAAKELLAEAKKLRAQLEAAPARAVSSR
jgi:hypothetical protein